MGRELAIRVSPEIGAWVRQQSGSASEVTLSLARTLWKRRQTLRLADPGVGEDRVKLRLNSRVIQFVRGATHSRNTATTFRKLLLWGAKGCVLPEDRPAPLPVGAEVVKRKPVRTLVPSKPCALIEPQRREDWRGVVIPAGFVPAHPSPHMPVARYNVPPVYLPAQPHAESSAHAQGILQAIPVPVSAIGIPAVLIVGGYYALKLLGGFFGGGAVTGAKAALTTATVAPKIAQWVPQIAKGLGVLL